MPRPVDLVKPVLAGAFGAGALLRGRRRSLHPGGRAFSATLAIAPEPPGVRDALLLRRERELDAVVRLSRSLGLPESLPDIYGAAVRVLDAYGPGVHQDLLFVTGGRGPFARHLFTPATGWGGRTMSTVLPYRIGSRRWVLLLRGEGTRRLRALTDLDTAAAAGRLSFRLSLAPVLGGDPVRLGRLVVRQPLDEVGEAELRFSVQNSGGGLEPVTWLNEVRPLSYRASQAARG